MQALVKNLVVFILLTIPLSAVAQVSGLLGDGEPTSPTTVRRQRIQPVQFEDLDVVLPPAASEAAPERGIADPTDPGIEPPPESGEAITTPAPEPAAGEVVTDSPILGDSGRIGLETGLGQTYDLPIGDVIHEDVAEVYSTNDWFRGGRWYSKQEFVMLLRTELPPVHVAVDASQGVSDPFIVKGLSTKDADFTYEPGTRLSLGRILGRDVANRDHSIEATFFGLFEYSGRAQLDAFIPNTGSGIRSLLGTMEVRSDISALGTGLQISRGFLLPFINNVDGFAVSRSQEILYEADLNSFELNYMIGARPARDRLVMQPDGRWLRHATPSRVRGMYAGLRYVRQHESFLYTAIGGYNRFLDQTGNITLLPDDPIDEGGTYRVNTDNDLFGVQLGGDLLQKRTNWAFGLNGRVGGLVNFADRRSELVQVVDDDLTGGVNLAATTRSQALNDETLAVLLEANAFVAYYVRPNTSVRLGYNTLFMNGLATATDNIGLMATFPKFEVTGGALYHGLNVGFEMTW